MIDRNRKAHQLASAQSAQSTSASNGKNSNNVGKQTAVSTSSVNSGTHSKVAEGFVDDLFAASQYQKLINNSVEHALKEFKTLIVEECNGITVCAESIRNKRAKKEEFRRQRTVYEGLNLHVSFFRLKVLV
jgi:hypothetical protein